MKPRKLSTLILQNAQKISELHSNRHKASDNKKKDPNTYEKAVELFYTSYDILAFPGGLSSGITRLEKKDPWVITAAIEYLEADPYCHRSGYVKKIILKLLKNISFTKEQIKQLQDILISTIKKQPRQEYREYCRLARKVFDEKFYKLIQEIIQQSDDQKTIYQAQLMLNAIDQEKCMLKK